MDDNELLSLLTDLESDRVERKASLSEPDRVRQAICAFANDMPNHRQPGIVFIGANDDGSCSGIPVTDELLRKLADMRDDGNIQPIPSMTVQKRVLKDCELAVVVVEPSLAPPVRFKGRTWIRVGPRRAIASAEEERRLAERRRTRDLTYDLHPLMGASIDDFDLEFFEKKYLPDAIAPDILELNKRSLEEKLKALRFLTPDGFPTVMGILVLARDPRGFIPGAYIQFLSFDGTELTDPLKNQEEIEGPLSHMLNWLDDVLKAHNKVSSSIVSGPIEVKHPEYPMPALQQLSRNAVLHRTYEGTTAPVRIYWFSDRIEIHSPGGTFGQVTRENFGQPGVTDYRNPSLAEAMKMLGYVQRFGVGFPIARNELKKNNNPELEFKLEETYIMVTVRKRRES